jgi:DNA-binding NarL/FixJ family response regulator
MSELNDLLAKYQETVAVAADKQLKPSVLVVDDDASIRRGLGRVLSRDFSVCLAQSAIEAIKDFNHEVACIILDVQMRKMTGFEAYKHFKTLDPLVPIIFYTAYQSEHDLSEIINTYKPEGYVEKGTNVDVLRNLVKKAIAKCDLARANAAQKKKLQAMVAELEKQVAHRKQIEKQLKQEQKRIHINNQALEETNTALKVLLQQVREGGKEYEENILINVKKSIMPYIKQLRKSKLNARQLDLLTVVETNLKDLVSPFLRSINNAYFQLTPGETQVADLVRSGSSTKEIAEILSLSPRTIEAYRESIREKTGIKNKNVNLRTHLLSFQ